MDQMGEEIEALPNNNLFWRSQLFLRETSALIMKINDCIRIDHEYRSKGRPPATCSNVDRHDVLNEIQLYTGHMAVCAHFFLIIPLCALQENGNHTCWACQGL
jgi:hypothetical protein